MAEIKNRATLDNTQFQAGLKGMQGQVQNLGQSLKSLPGIGSALTIAGITALTTRALNAADEIDNLSIQMSLGVETVQAYQVALGEAGLDMGTLQSATDRLTRAQAKAMAGNARYKQSFEALGISQDRLAKMGTEELLESTGKSMGELRGDANATAASFDLLGRNSERLRNVLIDTNRSGIQAQIDAYKELGLIVDAVTIERMNQAQLRYDRVFARTRNQMRSFVGQADRVMEIGARMLFLNQRPSRAAEEADAPVLKAMEERESNLEKLRRERAASRESDAQRELEALNKRRRLDEMSGEELRAKLQTKLKELQTEEEQTKTYAERLRIAREIYDLEGRISRIKEDAPAREEGRTREPDMGRLRRIGAIGGHQGNRDQVQIAQRQLRAQENTWRVLQRIEQQMGGGAVL